ncbi:unnamed protein product [Closterium sp. NIES-53]
MPPRPHCPRSARAAPERCDAACMCATESGGEEGRAVGEGNARVRRLSERVWARSDKRRDSAEPMTSDGEKAAREGDNASTNGHLKALPSGVKMCEMDDFLSAFPFRTAPTPPESSSSSLLSACHTGEPHPGLCPLGLPPSAAAR